MGSKKQWESLKDFNPYKGRTPPPPRFEESPCSGCEFEKYEKETNSYICTAKRCIKGEITNGNRD